MTKVDTISEIAEEKNGIIQTSDITERGISKPTLKEFLKKYNYQRISRGVYCSPDVWEDHLYFLQLRCPKVVFSHETALYLLDMTDQEPLKYTVTVKSGYNATHLREDSIKVFSIKKELFNLGIMTTKTPFGNEVVIYNLERTICDMIRNRSSIDIQVFQDSLKRYVKRKDKNLHLLMEYSEKLRVKKILTNYLEVLL
ncbi:MULTISPECIES: type IV toxin-antitoxin system AbiEi family antitoxin domain-containing protein [Enterococcus]|uniref:type IV toxin-antitoxin system AbiEi family antitoxin domain-containing protein n=1 Tax=Enterococcus TaxID=1350 RepID=UPI001164BAD5|nr:type IV toxin-antitoxin system AbiEi family antitoxin domain-containing protein [Enterococcus avium]HAP3021181.1 abortive phage infection protein [Enterococcus faecalis]AYQ24241.1 abortive phage infection protein [Enterococcus avium]HBI1562009.1 type IV toxin-antitoxin system AbiEi family antitoxin domain-containing protein [Enterococcus faecalis]HBI1565068.1 type IV toxin-antitoxin system AbiEi family antitoxin domain-containing protein [Enterococcus faecalis]HBI1717378.1 type IV toxin-ant